MVGIKSSGADVLTADANEARVATLRQQGVGKLAIWKNRAAYYAPDSPIAQALAARARGDKEAEAAALALIQNPAQGLVSTFQVATSALDGDFRKDLVEVSKAPQNGSGITLSTGPASAGAQATPAPRRGF